MTTKSLASKLAEVMSLVAYVQKDGKNDFHKYKYASAEKVYQKVNAELSARNIAVSSNCELLASTDLLDKVIAKVTLTLVDGDSSDRLEISGIGEGSDKGDKAAMKAITAATKYALSTGFLISWGDDPEADVSTDRLASQSTYEDLIKQGKSVKTKADFKQWSTVVGKCAEKLSGEELKQLRTIKTKIEKEITK